MIIVGIFLFADGQCRRRVLRNSHMMFRDCGKSPRYI